MGRNSSIQIVNEKGILEISEYINNSNMICDDLNRRGINFIQTNSECNEIRELYSNYNIIEVDVRRCINAKVTGRRGKELIICNY